RARRPGRGDRRTRARPGPLRARPGPGRPRRQPAPLRPADAGQGAAAPRARSRRAHRAAGLAAEVKRELLAAGARPRRAALTGPDALTAGERRVAALAADGLSSRQIAEHLFVTQATVETHLRHAFRKLNITSRANLPGSLH